MSPDEVAKRQREALERIARRVADHIDDLRAADLARIGQLEILGRALAVEVVRYFDGDSRGNASTVRELAEQLLATVPRSAP